MGQVEAKLDRGFSENGANPVKFDHGITWEDDPPNTTPTTFAQLLRQRVRGFFPPDAEGQVTKEQDMVAFYVAFYRELTKRGAGFQPLAEYNRHKLMVHFKLNAGQIDELSQAIGFTWRIGGVVSLAEALNLKGLARLEEIVSNNGRQKLAGRPFKLKRPPLPESPQIPADADGGDFGEEWDAGLGGEMDDDTAIYLHEIGKINLLTAVDEKRLGRQKEEAEFIQRLEESKYPERSVSPAWLVLEMRKKILENKEGVRILAEDLDLDSSLTLAELLEHPDILSIIDHEISESDLAKYAKAWGKQPKEVAHNFVDVSIANHILNPGVLEILGQDMQCFLTDPEIYNTVLNHESSLGKYFTGLKELDEAAEAHLTDANLRLVVSLPKSI